MPNTVRKVAAEVLDLKFDFAPLTNGHPDGDSDYLASGETISTKAVTVEAGLTEDSEALSDTNTSVTVWVSGGTVPNKYTITCTITTSAGRTAVRTMYVNMVTAK